MSRFRVLILLVVLASALAIGCVGIRFKRTPTPTAVREVPLTKERVVEFAVGVRSIEKERMSLILEHNAFSKEFSELSPRVVIGTYDSHIRRFRELEERLLDIPSTNLEVKRVHTKFIFAYAAEQRAFATRRASVFSLLTPTTRLEDAEEQLHKATRMFYEAEILFDEAHEELNLLLVRFGAR